MASILMIEDDMRFVRLVSKIMGSANTVLYAATALMGLKMTEQLLFDLVLLDMDLPDLDGKVVASMLRARPAMQQVPIIAVSAQSDATLRRLVVGFGCNSFISKPIDTRTFPAQILSYVPL